MNTKLDTVAHNLREYLTFYHEILIPQNFYFEPLKNRNTSNQLLLISSPSRMGNHILISMLDNHPDIPRIPGEDGLLSFSFLQSNYDVQAFLQSLRSDCAFDFVTKLGSNGERNKWQEFKKCYEEKRTDMAYSGVKVGHAPNILDFEGVVLDINYDAFESYLRQHISKIQQTECFNQFMQIYLNALRLLDYKKRDVKYDSYLMFSGMRTQVKWVCETYEHVKVLCSLRSFDSYCISHVRSRYGDIDITQDLIQEAWEHWYHKVIDMIFLKLKYPEKIGLVIFEDLISKPSETHMAICHFLGVDYHPSMQTATIMGHPVRGNSWNSRKKSTEGQYYKPTQYLDQHLIPKKCHVIWENLTNGLIVNASV